VILGFQKILVTLDGSELAETAVEYAMRIADPNAHIHLLSVIVHDNTESLVAVANSIEIALTGAPAYPVLDHLTEAEEIAQTKVYLEKLKGRVEQHGFIVTIEAIAGNAVDSIVDAAANKQFEVIVMATHGRTGVSKLVLGSAVEGVLHRASCPVLVIPMTS
jgi:nucleotide-binding universal stress UspA family protein